MHPGKQTNTAYRQHQGFKEMIRERDHHICQLCGQPGDIVDHIIPFAISHDSSALNLRILCRVCNLATRRQRKDKRLPIDQWYAKIEAELASGDAL